MLSQKACYDILQCAEGASPKELKRSFHRLMLEHHPDKGGDKQKCDSILKAYQTLTNPTRMNRDSALNDMSLDELFKFVGIKPSDDDLPKLSDTIMKLQVSASQAQTGGTISVSVDRKELKRNPPRPDPFCGQCHGTGLVTITQVNGSYVSRAEERCRCAPINADYVEDQSVTVDVCIEPGTQTGERILVPGGGNQGHRVAPGDLCLDVEIFSDLRMTAASAAASIASAVSAVASFGQKTSSKKEPTEAVDKHSVPDSQSPWEQLPEEIYMSAGPPFAGQFGADPWQHQMSDCQLPHPSPCEDLPTHVPRRPTPHGGSGRAGTLHTAPPPGVYAASSERRGMQLRQPRELSVPVQSFARTEDGSLLGSEVFDPDEL